jgi:predicted metal-binding protein
LKAYEYCVGSTKYQDSLLIVISVTTAETTPCAEGGSTAWRHFENTDLRKIFDLKEEKLKRGQILLLLLFNEKE